MHLAFHFPILHYCQVSILAAAPCLRPQVMQWVPVHRCAWVPVGSENSCPAAWQREPRTTLLALCDSDPGRMQRL